MRFMSSEEPPARHDNKLPSRHWQASEPFFDFKASHWVEIFLTVALFFVGVAQLFVYKRQATIMETQNKISEASQRASVVFAGFQRNELKDKDGNLKSVEMIPIIKNTGGTAATNVSAVTISPENEHEIFRDRIPKEKNFKFFAMGAPRDPDDAFEDIPLTKSDYIVSNTYIGPGAVLPMLAAGVENTDRSIDDIQGEKIGRFVYGSIHYTDFLGEEHISKYCLRVDGIRLTYDVQNIAPVPCRSTDDV
jgi:hypothetical protein